jgi:hypothetical protein
MNCRRARGLFGCTIAIHGVYYNLGRIDRDSTHPQEGNISRRGPRSCQGRVSGRKRKGGAPCPIHPPSHDPTRRHPGLARQPARLRGISPFMLRGIQTSSVLARPVLDALESRARSARRHEPFRRSPPARSPFAGQCARRVDPRVLRPAPRKPLPAADELIQASVPTVWHADCCHFKREAPGVARPA